MCLILVGHHTGRRQGHRTEIILQIIIIHDSLMITIGLHIVDMRAVGVMTG